jgi:predicted nuclease of predicted toxin-antitoxin system
MEQKYPHGRLYGSKLPASTFYIRNVSKLKMENISIRIKGNDQRIPIVIDRTAAALFLDLQFESTKQPDSALYLRNASDILIQNISSKSDFIVTSEKGNCSNLNLAKISTSKQKTVPVLLDQTYEKINAFSRHSFKGKTYRGLPCITADTHPSFTLKARKGSPCKILLLTAVPAGKSTIELLVNGKKQIAEVRSAEWGWSTLHLLNPVQSDTVTLQITAASSPAIYLAQAGLIPLKLTD